MRGPSEDRRVDGHRLEPRVPWRRQLRLSGPADLGVSVPASERTRCPAVPSGPLSVHRPALCPCCVDVAWVGDALLSFLCET